MAPVSSSQFSFLESQLQAQAVDSNTIVPTTPPRTNLPLPQSTPIKIGTSTTCPFTTNQKYRVESCTAMGEEMVKYLVGPMPAQQFLDEFFPVSKLPGLDTVPCFTQGCYDNTVKSIKEKDSYKPFVSPFNEFRSWFLTCLFSRLRPPLHSPLILESSVNSSTIVDCSPRSDFPFKIKLDCPTDTRLPWELLFLAEK